MKKTHLNKQLELIGQNLDSQNTFNNQPRKVITNQIKYSNTMYGINHLPVQTRIEFSLVEKE